MNTHKRSTWLFIGGLLIAMTLGLLLGSPSRAFSQGEGTPTHVPPPPRTLPPGIRLTPVPATAQNTPRPPSGGSTTPTPIPTPVLLPVSGNPTSGTSQALGLVAVVSGLGLVVVSFIRARRSRAK